MNAIILSIGDELVLGQTVDTNSAWMSQQLAAVGCAVSAHMTVADDQKGIEDAIRSCASRCDFLIISGGIGPTEDDLTRQALAAVMGVPLEENADWMKTLEGFFTKLGRPMPPGNRIQAMIPRSVTMIHNYAGTAAGLDAVLPIGLQQVSDEYMEQMFGREQKLQTILEKELHLRREMAGLGPTCRVFVMPGVPKEMKAMFTRDVLPHIAKAGSGAVILSKTLHTFGLGESRVAELLGSQMMRDKNPSVGTTVAAGVVSLRVNSRFDSMDRAKQELDTAVAACYEKLGDIIYGEEADTLASVVAKMLIDAEGKPTVTTAESCTGGLLAKMLTDTSGSSAYFKTGFITYANQSKYERLGVPTEVLNLYGAVSEPVVDAMAKNARRLAKATYGLSISGVAGPTGGSATKPVGTVCIALAVAVPHEPMQSTVTARTFTFPGDREFIRDRASKMALAMLRYQLLGKSMPF